MKKGLKRVRILFWLAMIVLPLASVTAQAGPHVDVLQIEGPVTPIMLTYIQRGIRTAQSDGAEALVIEMDTPGGEITLMGKVTQALLGSPVPVVVYVYPEGAFAASAGTLITLAGHAAAMAPGTTIGAASPVGGEGEDLSQTMELKVKEDLKAQARTLANRRGTEAVAWAESAIEQAKAATEQEALNLGVVDFVATDINDLLRQMDGFTVQVNHQPVTLHTAGIAVQQVPMNGIEQFLHTIANPTIAAIALTLGANALLFELTNPGAVVPGVVGAICLLIGFYSVGVLPVNYAGLIFVALAFVLFVVEVKAPTHGILTLGGIVSLVAGLLILFSSQLTAGLVVAVVGIALATGAFFAFAMAKVVQIHRKRAVTGREGLIGSTAQARSELDPEGTVFLMGELWNAVAENGPVRKGETVQVVGVQGFQLKVKRLE